MNVTGALVIYVIIWWLCFFTVLPRNVTGVWEDAGDHADGVEPGAPTDPQIGKKLRLATYIATPIWAVVAGVIASGVFAPDR